MEQADIFLAIDVSRNPDIQNPEGYATKLIQAWENAGIPNRYKKKFSAENQELADWEKAWLEDFQAERSALEIENK